MASRVTWIEDESPLRRVRWAFYYDDHRHALIPDRYEIEERPSPRHKFQVVAHYSRLSDRTATIREDELPLTETVARRAVDEFTGALRVMRWSEAR